MVDEEAGRIRTGAAARETLTVVLDLMTGLDNERLTERARNFRRHLDDLLRYFDQAAKVDQALQESVPDEAVRRELIRLAAWEIKARQAAGESLRRLKAQIARRKAGLSERLTPDHFQRLYTLALKGLSTIVRSSSMVENLNSRLRRFFDSARGRLNQNRLNLIRFYLNRKVFTRGWRKGRSPKQMFTGNDASSPWLAELHAMANA